MRRAGRLARIILGLAALVSIPACAQGPVTAFVDVTVVPMDRERLVPGQTVLVQGQRIVAMGAVADVKIPADAVTVDGRGKFLMPGLADMHAHLQEPTDGMERQLFLYAANGVTTIRNMISDSQTVALKRRVEHGDLLGPRIYPAFVIPLDDWSLEEIPGQMAAIKAEGYDFAKYYGQVEDLRKLDSAVAVGRRIHLPVVGHVWPDPGLEGALRAGIASIEHLTGYVECIGLAPAAWTPVCTESATTKEPDLPVAVDAQLDTARLRTLAVATQQAGVWNTPTVAFHDLPPWGLPEDLANLRRSRQIIKALSDAGAKLLLGTDWPNGFTPSAMVSGFSVHRELKQFVAAGLSPYQALETGTRNVAEFLGTLDSAGTVAVGKRADLVLLDGNPLKDVRYAAAPAGVVVAGRWLSRGELDSRLEAMARSASTVPREPAFLNPRFFEDDQHALRRLMQDIQRLPTAP